MQEPEAQTRKNRIDTQLKSSLSNWTIIPNTEGRNTTQLKHHAVEEYPTATGPADYALFADGKLLAIIEAKKITIGPESALEQAKRYSKSLPNTIGDWRGYRVPFLYSTNGESIYFLDVRQKQNTSRELKAFHSPQALLDKLDRDTGRAAEWFQTQPIANIARLRPYQVDAVSAVERALLDGKQKMLLAMATGTGKTFTMVSSMYRLLKSGYARRILFLVDRRVLAAQTVGALAAFETPEGLKLNKTYDVYSQKFRREELEDSEKPFDPLVLPESYLTKPQESHTFVYVSTIQRMAINLLGKTAVLGSKEHGDGEDEYDASRLDIPIHAFDVVIADECHRGYSAKETGAWKHVTEVFDEGDDFAIKITGKADRPLQKIREFRNRPEPTIVVTVDMLTTGVDIPAIEMVVFMRMVKSRILFVQMLGRGREGVWRRAVGLVGLYSAASCLEFDFG